MIHLTEIPTQDEFILMMKSVVVKKFKDETLPRVVGIHKLILSTLAEMWMVAPSIEDAKQAIRNYPLWLRAKGIDPDRTDGTSVEALIKIAVDTLDLLEDHWNSDKMQALIKEGLEILSEGEEQSNGESVNEQ